MKRNLLIVSLLMLLPSRAFASGNMDDFEDEIVEGGGAVPYDTAAFVAGKMGVLSSALWPRWRGVAFRVLTSASLDPITQSALGGAPIEDKLPDPLTVWLDRRGKILPSKDEGKTSPSGVRLPRANYGYDYGNCYGDAFATASATLQKRVDKFGAASKEIREWLDGQDAVFSNCEGSGVMPIDKIAAGVAPALQKDRDYQVAAALFYASRFPEARAAFGRIAADRDSEWSSTGKFVAARAAIRHATSTETPDVALLTEAEKQLASVLADPKASALHASARRLVHFIAFRTRPVDQLIVLGELLGKGDGKDLQLVLTDFAWLADKRTTMTLPEVKAARKSELTEWTLAWQLPEADAASYAIARHREKKTVPWLLLALATIAPEHADAKPLLEAARTIKPSTPGYLHAAYHRVRLLIGQKREPAARALIDDLLKQKDLPSDVRNQLTEQRYQTARTLAEAVPYMMRKDGKGQEQLSPAARRVFLQYLPIAETIDAVADARLPADVRSRALAAAFWRAALLDDVALAKRALATRAKLGKNSNDNLKTKAWAAATTPETRRFELVYMGLQRSWSLSFEDSTYGACGLSSPSLGKPGDKPTSSPPFVDAALQKKAHDESRQLDALIGNAATFRANETAAWAETHKSDRRMPEALHLAVGGTKHACDDKIATAASKRAWKVLHKLYPNDDYTRDTKYWYP